MSDESTRRDADQQSSDWLDVDHDVQLPTESELSADDQFRIADLQMVDALLSSLSSENDQRDLRIRRVMKAIEAAEPSVAAKHSYTKLKSAIALAASVLVVLSLAWSQFGRESRASVVLREIREMTLEQVDRVYNLRRYNPSSSVASEVAAKLYLRGRDGFVLQCEDTVLGRNADEYWLVPRQGDVLIAEDFQWMVAESEQSAVELALLQQLSADSRRVPIMQLSAVVELMKDDYTLALQSNETQTRAEHIVVGTLRDDAINLPSTISLWADTDSKIITRAEFSWGPGDTLSLELAPAEEVPLNWYTHEVHHEIGRDVRRASSF